MLDPESICMSHVPCCHLQLVIKIMPLEGSMLVNGSVQRRAEEVLAEVTVAQALYALCPTPDGRAAGEAQLITGAHHTAQRGVERSACKPGMIGQGDPHLQSQDGIWPRGRGPHTPTTRIVL